MPSWLIFIALTAPGFAAPGDLPVEDAPSPESAEDETAEDEPVPLKVEDPSPGTEPAAAPEEPTPAAPAVTDPEPPVPPAPEQAVPPAPEQAAPPAPEQAAPTDPTDEPPALDPASEQGAAPSPRRGGVTTLGDEKTPPTSSPPPLAILRGKVLERGSGKPVSGAKVVSGEHSAVVRADGTFLLPLPPGRRAVIVQDAEHLESAQVEELFPGDQLTVIYRVERWAWGKEVVVYGDKVREEVSRTILTAEELRLVPGSFGDPIRALQSLPGVARPATAEGDLIVRGAEAANTATYIDLVPVPYLFHFFIGRSVVNPTLLDDVEFYPGGMPTRFGNVTQAIVNARTGEREIGLGVHGTVSVDLLDFSVSAQARVNDHITWEAAVRESWIGGLVGLGTRTVAAARGNGGNVPGWAAPNYFDYSGRFTYEKDDDKVTVAVFGANDAFVIHEARDLSDPPDDAELGLPFDPHKPLYSSFHRLHARWDRTQGGWDQSTWIAAGPETEGNLFEGIGSLADGPDIGELKAWTFMVRRDDRADFGKKVGAIRFGAEAIARPVVVRDFDEALTEQDVEVTRDLVLSGGAWAEWQREWGTTWLGVGMRMSAHQFNHRFAPSGEPRLTLRQPINEVWTLTGFAGRFSQVPNADRYAEGIGNPDLKLITAWQGSAGIEGRWPSGVEVNVNLYGTWMENLVVKDQEVVLRRDGDHIHTGLSSVFTPVRGRAYGVETLLRMRPNNGWFGWVALSLSRAQRIDEDGGVYPSNYDQPVALTVVGARELPKDWRVSGRVRVTSGQPYTPLTGVYSVDGDYWGAIEQERNSERFPFFRQLDFRIDHTWTATRARWTLYLDVFNAFNHQNFFIATYDPTFQELRPQVWMPILPTLGIEVAY